MCKGESNLKKIFFSRWKDPVSPLPHQHFFDDCHHQKILSVVLICASQMAKDVEYLSHVLLNNLHIFWEKCLFKWFALF